MTENLIQALLEKHGSTESTRVALRGHNQDYTYAQVGHLVHSLSAELSMRGVSGGDRVLLQMPNSVEYVISFLAIVALGAIVVPLDDKAGPERLNFVKQTTHPKILITNSIKITPTSMTLNDQAVAFQSTEPANNLINAQSEAAIIFSSGSTGEPKGVVLRHRHLVATARNLANLMQFHSDHRELILSPICHTDGWQRVAATLFAGGCVVFYDQPLSVPHFVAYAQDNDISGFYSPPPFVRYLLQSAPSNFHQTCKNIEVGSAPLAPEELTKLQNIFPNSEIYVHFGLTESSRALAYSCRSYPHKLHTVGKTLPGVEIKIVDSTSNPASVGSTGEIYLRGEQCSDTYWNRPELSETAFVDGWLKTGDFGSLDSEGFLTYDGRRDDMINFGGFHFFPNEVEKELGPIPELQTYLIVGSPDPTGIMEQLPIMYAVKNSDIPWSAENFFSYARTRLPAFKIPRKIIFVPEIIRTHSGKPDRVKMLAAYGAS